MDDTPLFRISLAQWSLHRALRAGEMDALDFARVARHDFGIEAIEYVNSFFKDRARDEAYLAKLDAQTKAHGVKSLLIMVDGEGALGDPDAARRTTAVENHHQWVEAAQTLGCHSIRVNAQSAGTPEEQRERAADGLRRLTEYADDRAMNVIVENHGGLSSNGAWLASVIKTVDHPRCGTLPDFGNFRVDDDTWYDRYRGVTELMPHAKAVSAKSHDFDDAGNEVNTDYHRMMGIVLDAGYRGYVGIEYEGGKLSERDGIRATLELLERVRSELAAETGAVAMIERRAMVRDNADRRAHHDAIFTLARAAEIQDADTGNHVIRIRLIVERLAERLGFEDAEDLGYDAMLHDVGKLLIPREVLKKPGRLNDAERRIMESHTLRGAELLEGTPSMARPARIARSHHECWDGSGYPDGLGGADIPIEARITAAADVLDALVAERCYKQALPYLDAMERVRGLAGTKLDAQVAEALEHCHADGGLEDIFMPSPAAP